ncbi:MAG: ABC transporter permease [Planctomycetota bacterium]
MSAPGARRPEVWDAVLVGGYLLVGLLLVLPLAAVFRHALIDPATGGLGLANLREIGGSPRTWAALGHSLVVSLGGAAGAVALGLPLAYLLARYRIPGQRLLAALATLSLLSPPFIGAYAWVLLLGEAGALRALVREQLGLTLPVIYGPAGIVLVFATQFYAFVFLLTRGALAVVDRSLEEAASSLGATPWRRLRRVTLPLVLPSLSAGALMAFLMSLANFGTPMILGRDYPVLPTLAYDLFTSELARRPGLAATVCLVMVAVSAVALAAQGLLARRRVAGELLTPTAPQELRGWRRLAACAVCYGITALSSLPLLVVVVSSFRRTRGPVFQPGFGLESYRAVLGGVPRAVGNSLVYSLLASGAIVVCGALLGYAVARRRGLAARGLDALLLLPYLVPGLVLGVGFVVTFNRPPLALAGSGALLVLVYFIRRLPYSVRSSAGILAQLDPALEEAAASLGASAARGFWRVTLPLMTPGIVSGALLAWVTSVNELSASIVLYVGRTVTMPVKVYLQVLDGSFGPAAALATILLGATGLALLAIEMVSGAGEAAAS